eukprot:CAMPEP_0181344802 /NCGR_PEP_ID=MMETSP1101-20121128/32395_1 /TAXON_ID=46948 /ORGANISM="Rhodomonas abbreviata, Strain Caron Lab Isolate" /LENGTH=152 /DNA_ID=CAMNT_0023456685 /DNA_START=47 /DNA_END=501 /DNA_ORIENTATION=-
MCIASNCSVDDAIAGLFPEDNTRWTTSTFANLDCQWTDPRLTIDDFLPLADTFPFPDFLEEPHYNSDAIRWKLPTWDEARQANDIEEQAVSCRPPYGSALGEPFPRALSSAAELSQATSGKSEAAERTAEGSSSPYDNKSGQKEKKRLIAWT